jgi:FKBP-type peptidyl-prolyl cis-trans isomerase SlyD
MIIENKTVVSVSYTLLTPHQLTNEETVAEKTEKDRPLVWLYGAGMMIPDFEKNLSGKKQATHLILELNLQMRTVNTILII